MVVVTAFMRYDSSFMYRLKPAESGHYKHASATEGAAYRLTRWAKRRVAFAPDRTTIKV